jgi:hypothetical protein
MQRYNKIVNQANKTKKDILDDTMFMICMTANWRALQSEGQDDPLIDIDSFLSIISSAKVRISEENAKGKHIFLLHSRAKVLSTKSKYE